MSPSVRGTASSATPFRVASRPAGAFHTPRVASVRAMTPATTPVLGFDYALLRAVPRVDRGEQINVGALLYCPGADFLGAAIHLDADRLRALDPAVDVDLVAAGLDTIRAVCAGEPAAGRAGSGTRGARFGWLTAPRSTVIQTSPVHGGRTTDPAAELTRLIGRLVH